MFVIVHINILLYSIYSYQVVWFYFKLPVLAIMDGRSNVHGIVQYTKTLLLWTSLVLFHFIFGYHCITLIQKNVLTDNFFHGWIKN